MGLPAGHVTDPAIGLAYGAQLKALGNGVVPAQCALALRMLLGLSGQAVGGGGPLLPTPTTDDANNLTRASGEFQSLTRSVQALLPTPAVNDMGAGKTVEAWDEWTAAQKAKHGNGNGHGPSLAIEALRLGEP